jgi:MFS family permease
MDATQDAVRADLRRILGVQALRAFLYGFSSIVLATALAASGLSSAQVGLVFAAMLVGTAITSIGIGLVGDLVGRRPLYAVLLLVMGVAGAIYALTDSFALLVLVALTGTLSTDPNESGPITSLEQAMMGSAPAEVRTRVFAGTTRSRISLAPLARCRGPGAVPLMVPRAARRSAVAAVFPVVALVCAVLTAASDHRPRLAHPRSDGVPPSAPRRRRLLGAPAATSRSSPPCSGSTRSPAASSSRRSSCSGSGAGSARAPS